MKIGLSIAYLRNGGGTYQLLYLAKALKKAGHDVTIFTLRDDIGKINSSLTNGLSIRSTHFDDKSLEKRHNQIVGYFVYLNYLVKAIYTLYSLINKEDFDILNPHEWPASWASSLVKFKKGTPLVWMCNDVWHIGKYKEFSEKRIVFQIGDLTLVRFADIILSLLIDRIVVLDGKIKSIIEKSYRAPVKIVRSGVDLNKFAKLPEKRIAREKLGLPQDRVIFLCFSIFLPHRRFEDAVKAFKIIHSNGKNNSTVLVIAGSASYDAGYAGKIRSLITEYGLEDRVFLKTEYFDEKKHLDLLSAADVFIFPNERQTWGLIVIEAMASGKPCIVSSGAGVSEIIEEKNNGFVFKVKNVTQLAQKMEVLLKDKNLREEIGENARKYVFDNLSWGKYADGMLKVFKEVLTLK